VNHIQNNWEDFFNRAMHKDTSELQKKEMRMAFFCGAGMIFADLTEKLDKPEVSDQEGGDFMAELQQEILEFLQAICKIE
jgi:phosphoribosylaminoimidazole (AIR) synthetase